MVKPQQPQRLEDGKNWSIATTLRPPVRLCTVAGDPFTPARVCYRFGQILVAEHVFHLKGFDANNLVPVNPFAGQPVPVVHPAAGNFCVEPGHL